jgi:four helix bundle protein
MQSAEHRAQSVKKEHGKLEARLLQYAVRIIRLSASLPKTEEGLHIRRQILRSGTSAGANHQEARGAESRSDFIHKMQIVLKELRETQFWLRLIEASEILPSPRMSEIVAESDELIAMVVRSLLTARGGDSRAKP